MQRFSSYFERFVIVTLQILLMTVIFLATFELWLLLYRSVAAHLFGIGTTQLDIETVPDLQRGLQRVFAGVLLILLGLELMDTLKAYFIEHRVRLEVILMVAVIAVGRHIIQLDFEHATGLTMIGIASLVLALTGGYVLVRRSTGSNRSAPLAKDADSAGS